MGLFFGKKKQKTLTHPLTPKELKALKKTLSKEEYKELCRQNEELLDELEAIREEEEDW